MPEPHPAPVVEEAINAILEGLNPFLKVVKTADPSPENMLALLSLSQQHFALTATKVCEALGIPEDEYRRWLGKEEDFPQMYAFESQFVLEDHLTAQQETYNRQVHTLHLIRQENHPAPQPEP